MKVDGENEACWQTLQKEYGLDRKQAEFIRDEINSYIRTEGYADDVLSEQKEHNIDLFIADVLKDNEVPRKEAENRQCLRNITKKFTRNAEWSEYQEALMGVLLYLVACVQMIQTIIESICGEEIKASISAAVKEFINIFFGNGIVLSVEFSSDEAGKILTAVLYVFILIIWTVAERCFRGSKHEKWVLYFNRRTSLCSVLWMILFHLAGVLVYTFADVVMCVIAIADHELVLIIAEIEDIASVTLHYVVLTIRSLIVLLMFLTPMRTMKYWLRMDEITGSDEVRYRRRALRPRKNGC